MCQQELTQDWGKRNEHWQLVYWNNYLSKLGIKVSNRSETLHPWPLDSKLCHIIIPVVVSAWQDNACRVRVCFLLKKLLLSCENFIKPHCPPSPKWHNFSNNYLCKALGCLEQGNWRNIKSETFSVFYNTHMNSEHQISQ